MPPRPPRPENSAWLPASTTGLALLLLFAAWLSWRLVADEDGFLLILDSVNLAIHEFGHPFFAIFGEAPGWWGGTWMQLLVPLVIAVVFWYQRSALSLAFAAIWFFENLFNIARYVADARAQELPLVGGGEHDWEWILSRQDMLDQDLQIASTLEKVGWAGIAVSVLFAIWVWWSQSADRAVEREDDARRLRESEARQQLHRY